MQNTPIYVRLGSCLVSVQSGQLLLKSLIHSDSSSTSIFGVVVSAVKVDSVTIEPISVILLERTTNRLSSAFLSRFFTAD